jgi:vacuolar-type H+-ATPase subunit I/STV1
VTTKSVVWSPTPSIGRPHQFAHLYFQEHWSIAMNSLVFRLFPKFAKKKTLADFSLNDLNRQQLVLDANERTLTRKIEATEKEKEAEFKKAVANGSDRQRLHAAKKIQELDRTLNQCDSQLTELHSNKRVNAGIIRLKEDADFRVKVLGDSNILDITSEAIREEIEKEVIVWQVQADLRDGVIGALENHGSSRSHSHEDAGAMEIYRQILQAVEQQLSIPSELPAQSELESTKDLNWQST